MSKQITIPFDVTGWDAETVSGTAGEPALSRVTVKKSFAADEMRGESAGELLMCASQSGAAGYTIMDRFSVTLDGRTGSFVAIHGGMTDEMKAAGRIVPGSGTEQLKGIKGTLEFKSGENGKTILLDYSFEE